MTLLLALLATAAADDQFTFAPWSGASINITPGSSTLQGALTTPVFAHNAYLDAQMGVPAASLSGGTATGTYSAQLGLGRHTARSLQLSVEESIFADVLHKNLEMSALAASIQQADAWCHLLELDGSAIDLVSTPFETLKGLADGDNAQAELSELIGRIDGYLGAGADLARAGSCGKIPQAKLAETFAPIRTVVESARIMLAEEALVAPPDADDMGAMPYQALASRAWDKATTQGKRDALFRYGVVVGYESTAAEAGAGDTDTDTDTSADTGAETETTLSEVSFGDHTGMVGVQLLAVLPKGIAIRGGVDAALSDSFRITGEAGGAWVSRARSAHFYTVELSGRYTLEGGSGSAGVLAMGAIRPTDNGLSLACGVQYADEAWGPVFSVSGELPTL